MLDLAKRAVATKHFRWMPGMRMMHPKMGPARVLCVTSQGVWVAKEESLASGFRVDEDGCLPDLNDPATLGCFFEMAREAWNDETVGITIDATGAGWRRSNGYWRWLVGGTEAGAFVSLLEEAP